MPFEVLGTLGASMTDQKIIECLTTEFSKYYKVQPERIEQAFKIAKQELGDSMNAYYAVQTLLVRMFRDDSKKVWKITSGTEKAIRKILSQ